MMELRPQASGNRRIDARRPSHDQRVANPSAMGVLFVALRRRVAHLRPTPRVVVVRSTRTDVVEARDALCNCRGDPVEILKRVAQPDRGSFLRGTVVAEREHNRVVGYPEPI